ncbi:hypothetical protein FA15DRAFT_591878, partial [Coprinopsis marcescibilis]
PTTPQIWLSLNKGKNMTRRVQSFLWKSIHKGHKIGHFWKYTGLADTHMLCAQCRVPTESLDHILFEGSASGQDTIWEFAKQIWTTIGLSWPRPHMGLILGTNLVSVYTPDRKKELTGHSRLLRIILSESAYLIWLVGCKWRVGDEHDPHKFPKKETIEDRWLFILNKRLHYDRILTDRKSYGEKALNAKLVERTWALLFKTELSSGDYPLDWITNLGVLVSIGRARRPPGRNRQPSRMTQLSGHHPSRHLVPNPPRVSHCLLP